MMTHSVKRWALCLLTLVAFLCSGKTAMAQEAYAVYTNDGTLTFYYDNQKSSRSGTKYALNTGTNEPGWYTDHQADIKKAVFDSSFAEARPTSTYRWFAIGDITIPSILTEIVGIEYLNTSAVTIMRNMFSYCSGLTSLDVTHFDTSKVTDMSGMFSYCSGLTSLDVTHFDTSKVTDMSGMFEDCSGLTSLDVSHFNTSKVTNMEDMFYYCRGLTSLDVSHFNTGNVTNMSSMFDGCNGLTSLDVSHFNTSNVTNMGSMFELCSGLTSLDVSHFNTSKVTNMEDMFYYCSGLKSLDVTHFNTSNVTNMAVMFTRCSGLTSLDVSHFDTSKVTDMGGMFRGCSGLTSLDVSHFNTGKVTDMVSMFRDCSGLTSLDVSHFDTSKVTDMSFMFGGCSNMTTIYAGEGWNTDKVTSSSGMFLNCTNLVGGMGTKFDANHVDKAYAHIDGGPSNPGYLTDKNAPAPVSDSDDLQDFINGLGDNKGTEDEPVNVPVDPNGLTIDNDVDIVDDLQLAINGNDTENKVSVSFMSGFITVGQNSGLSFKNVTFAGKDVAAAMQQRAAANDGGIKNSGTLKFANCTFLPGGYTVENSSNTHIGEGVTGCRLINKNGGRINITSPLTDDLTIAVPTEADVEADAPIITGVSSADHILMTLPAGYAYKYDATAGGIVVYSTTGITTIGKQSTVMDSYDLTGRKVGNNRKGMTIHRMSDGTIKKAMTNQ